MKHWLQAGWRFFESKRYRGVHFIVPTIPATEVPVKTVTPIPGGPRKAVIVSPEGPIKAKKNECGMNLVFHNISEQTGKAIHVSFPRQEVARKVFLPLCESMDFVEKGFVVRAGERVTLAVKPTIGLEGSEMMDLPYHLTVEGTAPAPSGRPDQPPVTIHCWSTARLNREQLLPRRFLRRVCAKWGSKSPPVY